MRHWKQSAPLRVTIVSPTFGGYGGLEAFSLALVRGLGPDVGIEAKLLFKRTTGFVLRPELSAAVAAMADRVDFIDRGGAALRKAIAWADVVHAQNPSPDVLLFAKLQRRPVLINVINH